MDSGSGIYVRRMAAPQSEKRGLRRVKGEVGVKQWAWLLELGGVLVRFKGWWVGERSDVGGTARAKRVVGASTVSMRRRSGPRGVFIVHGFDCA